jgi:hypothetical protein
MKYFISAIIISFLLSSCASGKVVNKSEHEETIALDRELETRLSKNMEYIYTQRKELAEMAEKLKTGVTAAGKFREQYDTPEIAITVRKYNSRTSVFNNIIQDTIKIAESHISAYNAFLMRPTPELLEALVAGTDTFSDDVYICISFTPVLLEVLEEIKLLTRQYNFKF